MIALFCVQVSYASLDVELKCEQKKLLTILNFATLVKTIWFMHRVTFLQVSSKILYRQGFHPHQVLASAQPSGTFLLIAAWILHPVTSTFQNIFSTNVIETNFYFIQMFLQQQLKFFFHEWSPLRKLSLLCIYILTLLPVLVLLGFLPLPWCLPSQPHPLNKAIHLHCGFYTNLYPRGGRRGQTLGLIFF